MIIKNISETDFVKSPFSFYRCFDYAQHDIYNTNFLLENNLQRCHAEPVEASLPRKTAIDFITLKTIVKKTIKFSDHFLNNIISVNLD